MRGADTARTAGVERRGDGTSLSAGERFTPEPSLVAGRAHPECRACVIIPARNEAGYLESALDALRASCDPAGARLPARIFEIVLLLNNCTDRSASVARSWQAAHPAVSLHLAERELPSDAAHVGTARRWLMDTAWHRLGDRGVMLSTDADTRVAPDWIARNLGAIDAGADAVGGAILFDADQLRALPRGVRLALERDARYRRLAAELEDWIDPQAGDPWPRHLQHFGASLGCTREIYERAGGLPPERSLEDIAFVHRLWRADARLRHAPEVRVYSSARFDGRVARGLSSQLREWRRRSESGREHRVLGCAWLLHRFGGLRRLRLFRAAPTEAGLRVYPLPWRERVWEAARAGLPEGEFLAQAGADRLLGETFCGRRFAEIEQASRDIACALQVLRRGVEPVGWERLGCEARELAEAGD